MTVPHYIGIGDGDGGEGARDHLVADLEGPSIGLDLLDDPASAVVGPLHPL